MRKIVRVAVLNLLLVGLSVPALAQEMQKPEAIMEKMAFKLVRGVTNVATAIAEIPKQSYLSVQSRGDIGYVIGPVKGLGMGLYRAVIGATEAVFFLVPQPGYYDPMVDPEYVWQGWGERRADPVRAKEPEQTAQAGGKSE